MNPDYNFEEDELDDFEAIEFIKNQLPQEQKDKFNDEVLFYFLKHIWKYFTENEDLEQEVDEDGYINIDLEKTANYLAKEAKKDNMGEFTTEELIFVIQAEMDYSESQEF